MTMGCLAFCVSDFALRALAVCVAGYSMELWAVLPLAALYVGALVVESQYGWDEKGERENGVRHVFVTQPIIYLQAVFSSFGPKTGDKEGFYGKVCDVGPNSFESAAAA